jgi:hypothetical protein
MVEFAEKRRSLGRYSSLADSDHGVVFFFFKVMVECLCGLVVRVPGYRSKGPGLILGVTRLSDKQWVWNGVQSTSWVQLRSFLKEKTVAPVWKFENAVVPDPLH